jgi:hypothetical protein
MRMSPGGFKVSPSSVIRWMARLKIAGDIAP